MPWTANGSLVGKSLAETRLRQDYDVTVLGVGHGRDLVGGTHQIIPTTPDYRIEMGDTLMLVGDEKAVARFLAEH